RPFLTSNNLLGASCAVLLSAPLAFGAVEPWAVFLLELCAAVLLVAWALRQYVHRELDLIPNPVYIPALVFAALVSAQWIAGFTAYRQQTYSHLLLYVAYGMLAFVVTQSLRRTSQLWWLAWAVCVYGGAIAAFSLVQGLAPNGKIFWIFSLQQGGLIYGPYVNHNHYAGLMEMLIPFPLALAASRFTRGPRKLTVAGIGALMAATIFLSGSRGGMIAFGVQIVALALMMRPSQDWKQPLILGSFVVAMIGLLVWVGGNDLTHRLSSIHSEARQEISGGTRLTIDRDSLYMWKQKPILGWGLGTFPDIYPQFRSFYTGFFVNEAHNDYLQLLVETGVVGFSIAVWFLVITVRGARPKVVKWTENPNGVLTLAALVGCLGILVHSFLDFNLQIPANAALFYTLCAVAAAPALKESQRRLIHRHRLTLEPPRD
ncbi:MAG TPA: O-antigen ligase family protein, partial [Terriglobales bacterium]|nr:O-antigen ligase family protein [Terriglobales bacterium]